MGLGRGGGGAGGLLLLKKKKKRGGKARTLRIKLALHSGRAGDLVSGSDEETCCGFCSASSFKQLSECWGPSV